MSNNLATTSSTAIRYAAVGDRSHADFQSLNAWLDQNHPECELASANVVLVFQGRPGATSQQDLETAYRIAPLARYLTVLGSWCEGETRTGYPLQGVERCFWYEAKERIGRLRLNLRSPRTSTLAERISLECRRSPRLSQRETAVVVGKSRGQFEAVADALELSGFEVKWQRPFAEVIESPAAFVVWDGDDLDPISGLVTANWIRMSFETAVCFTLLNFPRQNEIDQLQEMGFSHVLGKPLLISDLWQAISAHFRLASADLIATPAAKNS